MSSNIRKRRVAVVSLYELLNTSREEKTRLLAFKCTNQVIYEVRILIMKEGFRLIVQRN